MYFIARMALPFGFSIVNFVVSFYMLYNILVHMLENFFAPDEDEDAQEKNDTQKKILTDEIKYEETKKVNEEYTAENAPLLIPLQKMGIRKRVKY